MDAIVYDKVGKEAEKVRDALYGLYPQETITDAAVASFDDGADNMPVKKLVAQIEPVQDLHGYDHPWPAGGGKNKLKITAQTTTRNGVTCTINKDADGNVISISVNGTATALTYFTFGSVNSDDTANAVLNGVSENGSIALGVDNRETGTGITSVNTVNDSTPFPLNTAGKVWVLCNSGSAYNTIVYPMIRLASEADATFAPYSNECPISGHTGAEITGTGKNLVPFNNSYSISADTTWLNLNCHLKPGTYIFTYNPSITSGAITFNCYNKDNNRIFNSPAVYNSNHQVTFTVTEDVYRIDSYSNAALTITDVMIRLATDIDDTYATYTGDQISVTFPSAAGTVYGGTLTLNPDRTGTLVVDRAIIQGEAFPAASYIGVNSGVYHFRLNMSNCAVYTKGSALSNILKYNVAYNSTVPYSLYNADKEIHFYLPDPYSDYVSARQFLVDNAAICYPLASPQTFQLTASEVSDILTTLYGTNNVWASTGNIEKLTYRADLGKYIDSHITTAVANALNA